MPAVNAGGRSRLTSGLLDFAIPASIGTAYLLFTFNPHYKPFLDDEFRFLLAMKKGTVAFFPGYIGFLRAAKAISAFFPPAASLQLIASLFGAASVVVFWAWMRRLNVPTSLAAAGTITFATGAYELYYSSVGVTYPVEAFAYLLTAYLCGNAGIDGKSLNSAAIVLAFCGAFRQTAPVFLLPFFLYCCYRAGTARPILIFVACSLGWLVPTIASFGGGSSLGSAATNQVTGAVLPSTIANSPRLALVNLIRFFIYVVYGTHLLLIFALRNMRKNDLLCIGPGAAFFCLVYVAWPGYTLGVLSVLVLVGVRSVCQLRPIVALTILAAVSVLNCIQFFALRPEQQPKNLVNAAATAYAFQYSKAAIDLGFQRRMKELLVPAEEENLK
jgi:hypothetical protein